jgi:ABC-type uncharacterized transport system substrate-binding protein
MPVTIGRRELATALGSVAVWPRVARAQQPKVPTIGALVIGNADPEAFWRVFREGLRDLGYVEGQNIRFEFRSAEGQINRLPELAAELVHLKVDMIVAWFTPTTQAAKQATREIPIVMADAGDPVGSGLVASLPRPGGNVTGIAGITAELSGKCIELIREMLPAARRVTALARAQSTAPPMAARAPAVQILSPATKPPRSGTRRSRGAERNRVAGARACASCWETGHFFSLLLRHSRSRACRRERLAG